MRQSRQVAFAVVLLTGAVLALVGIPTFGALLVGLFVVWWMLVGSSASAISGADPGRKPQSNRLLLGRSGVGNAARTHDVEGARGEALYQDALRRVTEDSRAATCSR